MVPRAASVRDPGLSLDDRLRLILCVLPLLLHVYWLSSYDVSVVLLLVDHVPDISSDALEHEDGDNVRLAEVMKRYDVDVAILP